MKHFHDIGDLVATFPLSFTALGAFFILLDAQINPYFSRDDELIV